MPQYPCLLALGLLASLLLLVSATPTGDAPTQQQRRREDDDLLKSLLHDTDVNDRGAATFFSHDDDFEVEFVYPKKEDDSTSSSPPPSPPSPVRRLWGVPDTETQVGRAFSYPIPDDAFEGDVAAFQFPDLPSWLYYNRDRRVVEGVPGPGDAGPHYVTVYAEGADGSSAKDAFAIQVTPVPASSLLKESMCSPKEDLTVVSVVLEASFLGLRPSDRIRVVQTLSAMFMVKLKKISLVPSDSKVDPALEDSAIMGGPGKLRPNNHFSTPRSEGQVRAEWSVGCDGEIHKEERSTIEALAESAKSGKLEDALDAPVLGWIVTQVNPSTKRVRRDLDYSGDYLENDYEYDYDEDYFNLNNVLDRAPSVPSLATPVFPDAYATVYPGEIHQPVSPVLRPVPLSTPVYVPVKPTRVVVEASPTLVYKTDYPYGRVDPHLDSSLLTHPTTSADYTTPLTSTSSVRTGPTREGSLPIGPTTVTHSGRVTTFYGVKTFPPRVISHIAKIPWEGGFVQRYRIPEKTFKDFEEGGTRNLSLSLEDEEGFPFARDSWIQFDPLKQEVYALPLREHVGKYKFKLKAMDKDMESVDDELVINVSQHKQDRIYNHEFTFDLKIEKKYEYDFAYALDWQVKAIEKIAALFEDSIHNIKVQKISRNPLQISWTNMTLTDSSSTVCPTEELEAIAEVMLSGHGSEPSKLAKKVFLPEFHLKKIHTRFLMSCDQHMYHERHHSRGETSVGPNSPVEGAGGRSDTDLNYPPILQNQIDQLNASIGHLFKYKVSEDFCYDNADGNTRKMDLRFLTNDFTDPPEDLWLKFDASNQEFLGLPLSKDVTNKDEIFQLVCIDSLGQRISDSLVVTVKNETHASPKPVIFSVTIEKDYDSFMSNVYDKARLLERLGRAFGDRGAEYIGVLSLTEGSVKLEWFNTSLPNDPCPYEAVQRLRDVMMDETGKVHQSFKDAFGRDFVISDVADIYPSSSCLAGNTPTHVEEHPVAAVEEEEVVPPRDEDYLLTFVVPAVIIAAMLLLAALVACCLYRRRRYGKMSMAGDRTFVSKGIPIIFAEELDDHRPDNAKSPVIMKEEKPPLPPPEYQRNSPPRSDRQRPASGDMNSSEDAPYHRPPPFTASNGGSRNQRPNLPPAYRKTPTYVPP